MSPTSPTSIGLQALSVSVPDQVLTNEHWHQSYPDVVAEAEQRIWMWKKPQDLAEGSEAFNREMAPYVSDPFRGARKRRFLPTGEKSLGMEADAARKALAAAKATPGDIDLLICTSFLPDSTGIGGATFLAQELGLKGAAWNLETACSSNLLAFQTACGLIKAGQYRRVLVMCSCTYSRVTVESDPICWGIGDAAIAMVVGEVEAGYGHLGSHSVHSAATCGAVRYDLELDDAMRPYFRLRTGQSASRLLRETSEGYLRECTSKALEQAGLALSAIDFCVFNTPLAWYAAFCARVLGFDRSRTISVYPLYANVGPALLGLNLFHAAQWGKIAKDSNVLLYSVGSVSSCCAIVVRWGDVALGPAPEGVTLHELEAYEAEVGAAAAELEVAAAA